MRKLIYVAGPFRSRNPNGSSNAWGVQCNVMRAMDVALQIWKSGHYAICPHANTMFFQDAQGIPDSIWLEGDLEILDRCDGIVMTPNWPASSGAKAELEYAKAAGIPIYYSIGEFLSAMENLEHNS